MTDTPIGFAEASTFASFALTAGFCVLVYATLHDIAARTVPDWTSLAMLALGLGLRWLEHELLRGVACGCAVFAIALFCWQRGWLGGGDVKLLGASAVFIAPNLVPHFVGNVALAGGVLASVYLLLFRLMPAPALTIPQRGNRTVFRRAWRVERWRIGRRGPLPYVTAIAAAAAVTLIQG